MSKDNSKKIVLIANFETLQTEFSDVLQVENQSDIVYLSFAQKIPCSTDGEQQAKVIHRIAITKQQFYKIKDIFDKVINDEDKAKGKINENS